MFDGGQGPTEILTRQITLYFVVDLQVVTDHIANRVVVDQQSQQFRLTRATARLAEAERQRIWAPVKARREGAA